VIRGFVERIECIEFLSFRGESPKDVVYWSDKKCFVIFLLLNTFPIFAQENSYIFENSRPFAGVGVRLLNYTPNTYKAYQINFLLEASLGYEFYLSEDIRPSVAFILGGGGKDWKIDGYDGGSSRYIYPAISIGMNFPDDSYLFSYLFKGFDIFYGMPIQLKKSNIYADGHETVDGIYGISPFLGFKIFENYRIILKYQLSFWRVAKSELGKYRGFLEESLRLHFQYVF
jgi:hypothetical protein